jgi:predicted ATPase
MHDAYEVVGLMRMVTGEFAAAGTHFEHALALPVHRRLGKHQVDVEGPSLASLAHSALCLWLLGYPDQASSRVQRLLTLLQGHPDPIDIVINVEYALIVAYVLHDGQSMRRQGEEIAAIATKHDIAMFQALGALYTGFARVGQGEIAPGIAQLHGGLDMLRQMAVVMFMPYCLALLAEAYGLAGQNAEALAALDEAIAIIDQTGESWWQAELFRLRGQLLLATGAAPRDIEAYYQRAIQVACQQEAKSLELRAAVSLARLWQQQGRSAEAYQLLAEIYGWFTEGFDTADLQEAENLLAELAQSIALPSVG